MRSKSTRQKPIIGNQWTTDMGLLWTWFVCNHMQSKMAIFMVISHQMLGYPMFGQMHLVFELNLSYHCFHILGRVSHWRNAIHWSRLYLQTHGNVIPMQPNMNLLHGNQDYPAFGQMACIVEHQWWCHNNFAATRFHPAGSNSRYNQSNMINMYTVPSGHLT